jgi:hypothetical protein
MKFVFSVTLQKQYYALLSLQVEVLRGKWVPIDNF